MKKLNFVLGIECTAHTFGAGIVETSAGSAGKISQANTSILANESAKYPSLSSGYVPRELADFHASNVEGVLGNAFKTAGIAPSRLSAVSYSYGPGIGHSLRVGFVAARTVAESLGVPLIPVNHCLAHLEIGRFFSIHKDALTVYVSGGNTQIIARKRDRYSVLGETLDLGLGNFLDSLGRDLGLKPPDAIGVLKEAAKPSKLLQLPYTVKGMNVSFTGLQTSLAKSAASNAKNDLCFSAQEYAFSMLLEAVERALVLSGKKAVLLVGGNARNKRLQEMASLLCREHGAGFSAAPFEFAGDNGAMIAFNGVQKLLSRDLGERPPRQKVRIGDEIISW